MHENKNEKERAILAGVHTGERDIMENTTDESMEELAELAETAGAEVLGMVVQNREKVDRATYLGEGKLEEIREMCENMQANLVVFDDELTGSQLKNIEKALGVRVLDRSALILDIFAGRAKSGEGKLQVELAQLQYRLPRLGGGYESLSRLGGGIGTRGPGETKIETDRRYIRDRISALRREVDEIGRRRTLIRDRRKKNNIPTAALVGYTNAGKSTLLNALTGADAFAEDMLFATLDPTARGIKMPDGRAAMLVDTVGFIRKLPHHLVEAFKSTLEEAVTADVLLHVIDASSRECENHISVVNSLLKQLGCADKPIIQVFNKCDLAESVQTGVRGDKAYISAATGEGIAPLTEKLDLALPGKRRRAKLLIPYSKGSAMGEIREMGLILSEDFTHEGTVLEMMADPALFGKWGEFICEDER